MSPPAPAAASGPLEDVLSPDEVALVAPDADVFEMDPATSLSELPEEYAVPIMASIAADGQTARRRAKERQAQSRTAQVGSISHAKVDGRIVSRRQLSGCKKKA